MRLRRQRFGGFLDRQPGEEPQLDDAREAFAEGLEPGQRGVERHELARAFLVGDVDAVERDLVHAAAALLPRCPARVVDDDLPHRLGGDGEEVAAIRPVGAGAVDQLEIRLVHEHRRVDRLPGPGAGELTPGRGAELGVDEAEDDVDRVAVAVADRGEEPGDLAARVAVWIGSAHGSSAVALRLRNYSCRERLADGKVRTVCVAEVARLARSSCFS